MMEPGKHETPATTAKLEEAMAVAIAGWSIHRGPGQAVAAAACFAQMHAHPAEEHPAAILEGALAILSRAVMELHEMRMRGARAALEDAERRQLNLVE